MDINKIREKLKTANRLYRDGNPIMSDTEYDALEQELKMLNPDDEWFNRGVNDDKPKNREMVLPHPMMSLDKVKNYNDLQGWMKKFSGATFVVTQIRTLNFIRHYPKKRILFKPVSVKIPINQTCC